MSIPSHLSAEVLSYSKRKWGYNFKSVPNQICRCSVKLKALITSFIEGNDWLDLNMTFTFLYLRKVSQVETVDRYAYILEWKFKILALLLLHRILTKLCKSGIHFLFKAGPMLKYCFALRFLQASRISSFSTYFIIGVEWNLHLMAHLARLRSSLSFVHFFEDRPVSLLSRLKIRKSIWKVAHFCNIVEHSALHVLPRNLARKCNDSMIDHDRIKHRLQ